MNLKNLRIEFADVGKTVLINSVMYRPTVEKIIPDLDTLPRYATVKQAAWLLIDYGFDLEFNPMLIDARLAQPNAGQPSIQIEEYHLNLYDVTNKKLAILYPDMYIASTGGRLVYPNEVVIRCGCGLHTYVVDRNDYKKLLEMPLISIEKQI